MTIIILDSYSFFSCVVKFHSVFYLTFDKAPQQKFLALLKLRQCQIQLILNFADKDVV